MIDTQTFHRIARTFADDAYEINRDQVTFVSRDELIDIRLQVREAQLFVVENGVLTPAGKWLATRLARLPFLAERILQYCAHESNFIIPSGDVLLCPEHPEFTGGDTDTPLADAIAEVSTLLEWQPTGTTSVVYLTSDGGEGKTTLTNTLAIQQAERFRKGESQWLVLPVELGGRPFLRLDEVSIGTLVNKLRFSYLYYDSLIEFCRLGYLVLAIDGFEEMFIHDPAGDATSSLGRLLGSLDSSGRVLICARKAFFELNSLADQTRLYDSIRQRSVAFSRVALRRWTKSQFCEYLEKRHVAAPEELYSRISIALKGADHPLLTRPVLVEKLTDAAQDAELRARLLSSIEAAPADYLDGVITALIVRETQKWVDRSGEVPTPLLSVDEHLSLLGEIALEMWRGGGQVVREDTLSVVAGLFAEGKKKSSSTCHQIVKWAPQHALLTRRDARFLEFDHEETFLYFLGRSIAAELSGATIDSLRTVLRSSVLPYEAGQIASKFVTDSHAASQKLQAIARSESATSIGMENAAVLLAPIISGREHSPSELVEGVSFPARVLDRRSLHSVHFRSCVLAPVIVGLWRNVVIEGSSIERLSVTPASVFVATVIDDNSRVLSVGLADTGSVLYDPSRIRLWLETHGLVSEAKAATSPPQHEQLEPDWEFTLAEKCIQLFMRATELNELSLKKRLGTRAPVFFERVLPKLLSHGIVSRVHYQGAGHQERFELGDSLTRIADVMERSEGQFATFLSKWDANTR